MLNAGLLLARTFKALNIFLWLAVCIGNTNKE